MIKNSFLKIGFILILMGIFIMSLEYVLAYINDYSIDIEKSNNIKNNINYYYEIFNLNANELKDDMVIINDSFNVYFDDFDIGKNNILSFGLTDFKYIKSPLFEPLGSLLYISFPVLSKTFIPSELYTKYTLF